MAVTVESIVDLYNTWGHELYDEEVSQINHARQCAALAARDGADDALCVSALLHDIGHLFEIAKQKRPDDHTDLHHEMTGSQYLAAIFPPTVTVPIALHVDAKRHLTAVDSEYLGGLSDGSRKSLERQGGPFLPLESATFLQRDGSSEAIRLRRWDDSGKALGLEVPEFDSWIPALHRVAVL